jgi:hypothetical protein
MTDNEANAAHLVEIVGRVDDDALTALLSTTDRSTPN